MKKYNCPHCEHDMSTNLDEEMIKNGVRYSADFFFCPECNKEYRLILIEDLYIQVGRMSKKSYDKFMRVHDLSIERFQNDPTFRSVIKYKTWVRCISDDSLNQYFNSRRVIEHKVGNSSIAVEDAISDAAINIFTHQPQLKSVKLMCYYNTAACTTTLEVHTIYNKEFKISIEYIGFSAWNRKEISPITWCEEDEIINVDVPTFDTPFPYILSDDEIW